METYVTHIEATGYSITLGYQAKDQEDAERIAEAWRVVHDGIISELPHPV